MNMQFYLWGIFHSLKAQQEPESPLCSYTATENTVSVSQKANEEIEIVASEVDKWMTSNRNVTCMDDSQDEFSKIHSNQPDQNSTASRHVHKELKREQWSEFDVPPGYSRHSVPPHPKMSHVAKEVNTPGSSNLTKLREEVSSSKIPVNLKNYLVIPSEHELLKGCRVINHFPSQERDNING